RATTPHADRFVVGPPGAWLVARTRVARGFKPRPDDRVTADEPVVRRVVAVPGVLAEQVADRGGVVGGPGSDVPVEPGLDVVVRHAGNTSSARSMRARTRSRPRATSVSNSGGVAVRPVTA